MIALRLLRSVLLAAAGAALTLAQLNLPSKRYWDSQSILLWAGVVVLAGFVVHDGVRSVNDAVQAARFRDYDNDLRVCLSATVAQIVRNTGVPWDQVSVRYYRVRRVRLRRRLVCVAGVAAGADISRHELPVAPGVGIVGTAFSSRVAQTVQWRAFVRANTVLGPQAWDGQPPEQRYGLTWGQLRRSPQPEAVVASPTFRPDGAGDGCIAVSGSPKIADPGSAAVQDILDELAIVLDRLGRPPAGWWAHRER